MRYHIYWQDKILLKDLDEEEFKNIWEKMHWVYNNELNYVEVGEHNFRGSIPVDKRIRLIWRSWEKLTHSSW